MSDGSHSDEETSRSASPLGREFAEAIEEGDIQSVRRMLALDAELPLGRGWCPPPLHCCVLWRQLEIARILLEHGADLEQRDPDRQTTPLRYAVIYARLESVQFFLEQGADSGPLGEQQQTALELAKRASLGEYEEYDDLPRRDAYQPVVALLERWRARGE